MPCTFVAAMMPFPDVLKTVFKVAQNPAADVLFQKEQQLPGSVRYTIARHVSADTTMVEDAGVLSYCKDQSGPENSYLQLHFCLGNNKFASEKNVATKTAGFDIFHFHFTSAFLAQFVQNIKLSSRKDEVLAFRHPHSFTKLFSVCNRKRAVLQALLANNYSGAMENIFVNAKVHELLLYSIECLVDEGDETFACRFLADESGRERIYKARDILLQRIGEPITIKELSRKVAINECYLKKGFKEVFGTTIFDFYQQQRMEHAKYLLYEKGLSVTDVSAVLGYSSISHFSSAFKKHTGLKPCDLLR